MLKWHGGAKYYQISLCKFDIIDKHLLQSILILLGGSIEARKSVPRIILGAVAKNVQIFFALQVCSRTQGSVVQVG